MGRRHLPASGVGDMDTGASLTGSDEPRQDKGLLTPGAGPNPLERVLAMSPAVFFTARPDGSHETTFVSGNLEALTGWTPDQMLEQPALWLSLVHPEDRTALLSAVRGLYETGEISVEFRFRHRAGHYLWLDDQMRLLRAEDGSPSEVVGFFTDVTDRRTTEEALRRSERLATVGTLAAGLAHEVNNPVGSMLVAAQYALEVRDEPDAREQMVRALQIIVDEARRTGLIVKSVLRFARQQASEKWNADLNAVVMKTRDHLLEATGRKGATLVLDLGSRLPPVRMNPTEIEQVISNLVRNAIEAGERGIQLLIRTSRVGGWVRLLVRDDGPGIARELRNRVFEPFFTTRRNQGGTGLGLSVVHGIVRDHGGRIHVDPREGGGTDVTVDFPVLDEMNPGGM